MRRWLPLMLRRDRHPALRLCVAAKSDVGRKRGNNEDRYLLSPLVPTEAARAPQPDGEPVGPKGFLLAVADGMGGAAGGDVASGLAVQIALTRLRDGWVRSRRSSARAFASFLRASVAEANRAIHQRAIEDPDLRGMGSTLTAVGVLARHLVFAQVGDSRAYLVRGGKATQITEDQSLLRGLMAERKITEEEARSMPGAHMILQALGPRSTVDVELSVERVLRNDAVVLCTDGLWGVVTAAEINAAVRRDPVAACEDLVDLANARGGPDNITVVVGKLHGAKLGRPRDR